MTSTYDLPMPGVLLGETTVIASTYINDDDPEAGYIGLVLLNRQDPYYTVTTGTMRVNGYSPDFSQDFRNIVPAAAAYQDVTGCF